jgi:ComF family protein
MSNQGPIRTLKQRLGAWLVPAPDCLLCGARTSPGLLCPGCRADLPGLPETCCSRCALPLPTDGPCGSCLQRTPQFDVTVAAYRYSFPIDRLVQALKYGHQLAMASLFAEHLLAGPQPPGDLLLPVPLAPDRLRERGFNQALEIARPLARRLGLDLAPGVCLRRGSTTSQASLPWKARHHNVRHAFECRIDLSGAHVLVVDDVMTTGATLNALATTLKYHGAASVSNWVVARTLKD